MCVCRRTHVSNLMHVCCEGLHKHMHIRGHRPPTSSGDILLVRPVTILTRVARLLLVLVAICIPALWGAILLGRLAAHTHKHQFSTVFSCVSHSTKRCPHGGADGTRHLLNPSDSHLIHPNTHAFHIQAVFWFY